MNIVATVSDWTGLEKFFLICAIVGGIFFAIRLILMFIGGDADFDGDADVDVDMDVDADVDVDADGSDSDVSDTDISFRALSLQGITSFFLMFGLVGLALHRQTGWDPTRSIIGASLAGFLTVWMLKWLFNAARKLQSSGNIKLSNAIGQEGTVYLSIPPTGTGKVQVKVQNHLKIMNAVSEGEVEIKTDERIRVIRIISNNILVVEKLEE